MSSYTASTIDDTSPDCFAAEVRARAAAQGLSLAQLATAAELDPSLVSRLVSATGANRRAPRPEHVLAIARALGVGPLELGPEAAAALAVEWVPRAELDREIAARQAAQAAEDKARRELEALRAGEFASLGTQIAKLERELAAAGQARARAEQARRRAEVERDGARTRAAALEQARAGLAADAQRLERELEQAQQTGLALWQQAQQASGDAVGAKVLGLLGTIGGAAAGFAAGAHAAAASARAPRAAKTTKKRATRR